MEDTKKYTVLGLSAAALAGISWKYFTSFNQKSKPRAGDAYYESHTALDAYLTMHYAPDDVLLPHKDGPTSALQYPRRCVDEAVKFHPDAKEREGMRVLDVGCAVGRSTYEFARFYGEVVGIDFSHSFIDAANQLKADGQMDYVMNLEGDNTVKQTAVIDKDIDRSRCTFLQGDACCLDLKQLGQFDAILGANLICRLPDPAKFLADCSQLVKSGGYLLLPSPYSWLEEYTAKDKWLGGRTVDGKQESGSDGIRRCLEDDFEFVEEKDMPFFIRETHRRNQWTVAHLTVWKRK